MKFKMFKDIKALRIFFRNYLLEENRQSFLYVLQRKNEKQLKLLEEERRKFLHVLHCK